MVNNNISSLVDDHDPDLHYFNFLSEPNQSRYLSVSEYNQQNSNSSGKITIFNINIRSYFRNIEDAIAFLSSLSYFPDIIIFTETWLNEIDVEFANLEGYNGFHTLRDGRSGGVSVFCSKSLNCIKLDEFSYSDEIIESCCVQVGKGSELFHIFGVYRPVSGSVSTFNDVLDNLLNKPGLTGKKICIAGDININLLNAENSENRTFISNMHSMHFLPTILNPTRFQSSNSFAPSLLDHIWINFISSYNSGIIWSDFTDHCPVFIILPYKNETTNDKIKIEFRDQRPTSVENFLNDLYSAEWDDVSNSIDQRCINFLKILSDLYCTHFPKRTKFVSAKRLQKPWLTPGILNSVKTKSKYFKQYKMGIISKETNTTYRNLLNKVIRRAKRSY